jgi:hypothetical protein
VAPLKLRILAPLSRMMLTAFRTDASGLRSSCASKAQELVLPSVRLAQAVGELLLLVDAVCSSDVRSATRSSSSRFSARTRGLAVELGEDADLGAQQLRESPGTDT